MKRITKGKKREIHPIVRDALELAYEGVEPIAFADWAIDEIKQSLGEYFGQPELVSAVASLLELGVILGEKGCTTAALQIIEVVTSATEALNELNLHRNKNKKF